MADTRRVGRESSETRTRLLDVAERIMLEEGYAAVGTRRIARVAGVAPALVYYYFPTLDELFLAVLRRRGDEQIGRQADLLAAESPLRSLWEFTTNPAAVAFTTEFLAAANHRKVIRAEWSAYSVRYLDAQEAALCRAEREGRVELGGLSPRAVLLVLVHVARGLMVNRAVGVAWGEDDALALVERLLDEVEPANRERRAGGGDAC